MRAVRIGAHLSSKTRARAAARAVAIAGMLVLISLPAASAAVSRTHVAAPGTWTSSYTWSPAGGYSGWQSVVSAPAGAYGASAGLGGNGGLWLWPKGGAAYGPGWIEWKLDAPGTTTITDATVTLAVSPSLYAHHCVSVRLQAGAVDKAVQTACKPISGSHAATVSVSDAQATSTALVVRLEFPACRDAASPSCEKNIPSNDPTSGMAAAVQAVQLTLSDTSAPTIALSGSLPALAGHYIDGTQSYGVDEAVADSGSGVSRAWLDVPRGTTFAAADAPCDPTHQTASLGSAICPPTFSLSAAYDTSKLPEGPATFSAQARDYAANTAATDWTLYVDRTPPTVAAAGDLYGLASHFIDGTKSYGVTLSAADPGADTQKASGIARAWVDHDGATTIASADDGICTDFICPSSFSPALTVDTTSFPAGKNVLVARTADLVGHTSATEPWAVYVDRTPPTPSVGGAFAALAGTYISGRLSYDVTLGAVDPGAESNEASGIASAQLMLHGAAAPLLSRTASCAAFTCPPSAAWTASVDTSTFPEGADSFDVEATDLVGHTNATGTFTIFVDRSAPSIPQNIALYARDTSAGTATVGWDPSDDPALADGSDGSGVGSYEIRQSVDGAAWSPWRSVSDATASLSDVGVGATIGVQVRSVDKAGNASAAGSATLDVPSETPPPLADGTPAAPADPEAGDLVQPWVDPQLTGVQEDSAASIAHADPRAAAIVGASAPDQVQPWQLARQPTLIGATVHYTFPSATTIEGDWLLVAYNDQETSWPPYETHTVHDTIPAVTGVTVYVDLHTKKVVGIEPDTDSTHAPAVVRRLRTLKSAKTAEGHSGGRATGNLRALCLDTELCFYNYDFDASSPGSLGNERWRHVDWPVTLIFYGNANVDKVKQSLGALLNAFGSSMHGRVWDRQANRWVDDSDAGTKAGLCNFWDHEPHVRYYAAPDNAMFSIHYGYTVIGTTHRDWMECVPFASSHAGDTWETEHIVADFLDGTPGIAVKRDAVALHNREGWPTPVTHGSSKLHNDGAATLIWYAGGPVDANGNPPPCTSCNPPPDNGGPGPVVEVSTESAGTNLRWVNWNSFENGGSIAFCRAHFEPSGPGPTGEFTIDTGPAGGPQLWTLGPGTLTFTCWDTHSPQRSASASAPT